MLTLTPRTPSNEETNYTRYQKNHIHSQDVKENEEDQFEPGQIVYVKSSDGLTWNQALVSGFCNGHLVVKTGNSQERKVSVGEAILTPTDESYLTVDDLTSISPLSPPAVLECLLSRYGRSEIYTWAGHTLVALNPFTELNQLCGPPAISHYFQLHKAEDTKCGPPHVYSVAARAYNGMRCGALHPDQSIIVSGESGAGKTVSARHLMKYLVTVANHSPIGQRRIKRNESFGCEIERRILNSNPILEAFGNAGTLRNDNSSRFGKYVELQFDKYGYVSGAAIQTYLLEKTRVVQQGPSEHTFHIFYQLLAGLDRQKQDHLQLNSLTLFTEGRSTDDDKQAWLATVEALSSVQVSHHQLQSLLKLLSAILHLNQIVISVEEEDEDVCCIDPVDDLAHQERHTPSEITCQLLAIDQTALVKALTHRRITASHARRKSVFAKPCSPAETQARRDCLAKLLYNQLFDWLVTVINRCIYTDQIHTTIGILDIYGFESFQVNSLEQLCINYANECLQQHYVTHFLRDLQAEYAEEAITWSDVQFVDNRPCLSLLEGCGPANPGLFSLINEECQVNRPDGDEGLRDRLLTSLGSGKPGHNDPGRRDSSPPGQLGTPRQNRTDPSFIVQHYASPVTYSLRGLLEKNKDNVPPELVELLQNSSESFIVELFENYETEQPGKKKKTVLAKFKSSLDHLMEALSRTEPHYIRCIKPKESSSPAAPDQAFVMEQLRACGIVETVEVNRKGYPSRIPYERFLQHYSLILRSMPEEELQVTSGQPERCNKENELVFDPLDVLYQKQLQLTPRRQSATAKRKLRRRAGLSSCDHTRKLTASILCLVFGQDFRLQPSSICQFGISKLFLKDGKLERLERMRLKLASTYVYTLQCAWRRVVQRKRMRQRAAATRLQASWRGYIERVKYRATREAVKTLQGAVRSWLMTRRRAAEAAQLQMIRSQEEEITHSPDLRLTLSDDEEWEDGEDCLSEFYSARSGMTQTDSDPIPQDDHYHTPMSCCDTPRSCRDTPMSCYDTPRSWSDKTITEDSDSSSRNNSLCHDTLTAKMDNFETPKASFASVYRMDKNGFYTPQGKDGCYRSTNETESDAITLYTSPRTERIHSLSPLTVPLLRHEPSGVGEGWETDTGDINVNEEGRRRKGREGEREAYVVCEEREDGCNTYHIMPSPCPGGKKEGASEVLRRVTTAISTTYLSRWRFTLAGAFRGIPYLEAQNGIISRRRMPRVQIKFHTRANHLMQGAHYISHREFECSLSDCLV